MPDKNTQIRNKKILSYPKSDIQKLAGLEVYIHNKFPNWKVYIEPYMLFSKGEDKFIDCLSHLTEKQVSKYKIHSPDVWIILEDGKFLVLELDGSIHDVKVGKTLDRNKLFERNKIDFCVVNETDLKFELGLRKSVNLTQEQINNAFEKKILKLL